MWEWIFKYLKTILKGKNYRTVSFKWQCSTYRATVLILASLKIQLTLLLFVFIDFNHLAHSPLCTYTFQYKEAGHYHIYIVHNNLSLGCICIWSNRGQHSMLPANPSNLELICHFHTSNPIPLSMAVLELPSRTDPTRGLHNMLLGARFHNTAPVGGILLIALPWLKSSHLHSFVIRAFEERL